MPPQMVPLKEKEGGIFRTSHSKMMFGRNVSRPKWEGVQKSHCIRFPGENRGPDYL